MRVGTEVVSAGEGFFSPHSMHTQLVAQVHERRAAGDVRGVERATSLLIQAMDPLLKRAAARLERQRGSLAVDDLLQVGRIEVVKAIDTFDPTRAQSFSTLVWWGARDAMLDAVRLHSADVRPSHGAQKGRVKKAGVIATTVESTDAATDEREDATPLADQQLMDEQARVLVRKLLHRLPRHMADLIRKVHGIGVVSMSVRDIAETTRQNRARLTKELKRGEQLLGQMVARELRTPEKPVPKTTRI